MYKQVCIDGIQTYLFRADELEEVLVDSGRPKEFLRCIRWHRKRVREIEGIDKVKLYPAVCLRNSIVINVGTCCSAI